MSDELIEKLTPAQERRLPKFRDEWWRWGTSTKRANRKKAEAAILAMRAEIGSQTKPVFVWCDSPATSLIALHVIKSEQWQKFIKKELRSSLRSSLGSIAVVIAAVIAVVIAVVIAGVDRQ